MTHPARTVDLFFGELTVGALVDRHQSDRFKMQITLIDDLPTKIEVFPLLPEGLKGFSQMAPLNVMTHINARQDSDKRHKLMAHMDSLKKAPDPEDNDVHDIAQVIWEAMEWVRDQQEPMPGRLTYRADGNSHAHVMVRDLAKRIRDQSRAPAKAPGMTFDEWLKEGDIMTRGERLERFMGFPDDHTRREMLVSWLIGAWNAGIESGQPLPRDPDTGFRRDGKSFYPYDKR